MFRNNERSIQYVHSTVFDSRKIQIISSYRSLWLFTVQVWHTFLVEQYFSLIGI